MARFGIFSRRKTSTQDVETTAAPADHVRATGFGTPAVETKSYGMVTANPVLVDALRLWNGGLASYGTVYRQLHPVRTVIDFIADAVSTTPLKVHRKAPHGRPEVPDHPLAQLLENPNPDLTSGDLIFGTVADLGIYGTAYWRKVQAGRLKSLVPLPPFRVTPVGGDLLAPAAYDFFPTNGHGPIRFDRDEIVHFKLYDPEDRRVGSSKLEALRNILLEEVGASRSRTSHWTKGAQIAGVLEHPETLTDEALTRLRTQFDNIYSGTENAGQTAILEEGMTFHATGITPKDAEFVAGRALILEATLRVFNVQPAMLGLSEQSTFASQREKRKQLYTETLPSWFERIQAGIELQLMPWFSQTRDLYVEFLVEAKLRGDFIDQAKIVLDAVGRPYMTLREGRDLFNLEDRGEPRDDEMVIPVGPNLALESQPIPIPVPNLAPVAALPVGKTADALSTFFDKQERRVIERMAEGKPFETERWNRELAVILKSRELAERVNFDIARDLEDGQDPATVFEFVRTVHAGQLALEA